MRYGSACGPIFRRALGGLLRLPGSRVIIPIRQGPARGLRWIMNSQDHRCWLGTYEPAKQRALARFIVPGMTIYDLGANAGFYTLMFSRLTGPAGKVFAFEPGALPLPFLLRHLAVNGAANVQVVQAAVGAAPGLGGFTTDLGTCMNQLLPGPQPGNALIVPVLSLDQTGLPPPDVIKIDVEGAESAVLRGAARILRDHAPLLFIALHNPDQRRECRELLRTAGYQAYDLEHAAVTEFDGMDEIYAVHERRLTAAGHGRHAHAARARESARGTQ